MHQVEFGDGARIEDRRHGTRIEDRRRSEDG